MPLTPRIPRKLALVAAAALAAPLLTAAPPAAAGDVKVSVQIGNRHGGGHYKKIWHPPVYKTYYDACGTARRTLAKAGYYKRVWVASTHRSGVHKPVHHRHHDRLVWSRRAHRTYGY